jgi:hypothetical protein
MHYNNFIAYSISSLYINVPSFYMILSWRLDADAKHLGAKGEYPAY